MATKMSDEEAKKRREAAQQRKAAEQAAKQAALQSAKTKVAANKTATLKSSPLKTATKKTATTKTTTAKKTSAKTTSKTTSKNTAASSAGTVSMKKDSAKKTSPLSFSQLNVLKADLATGNTVQKKVATAKASGLATGDQDAWQESKKQQQTQRLKAKQEQGKQKLSKYDSTKLNKTGKQLVREAKVAWGAADALGDEEGKSRAHQKAESARSYSGYSGGDDGSQYIQPDMGWAEGVELNKLTYEGRRQMNKARMDYYNAQQAGDKAGMEKARQRAEEIRSSKGLGLAGETGSSDAHGRTTQNFDAEQDAKRLKAGAESIGKNIAGSLLSVSETGRQFYRNYTRDRWGSVIDANANQADALRAKLALAEKGEGNPEWGTVQQLRNRLAAAEGAEQRRKTERTTVDPNLPGQTLLREGREAAAEATRGLSGADKLLANTALSMGQTLPGIAVSFVPGIGPALGLGLMGAQAAGSKASELNEQGVDAREAMTRGLISGGIEALAEKFSVGQLLDIVKGPGGRSFLKNVAKQAGVEASEETASYLENLIVDKYANDPNAKFSMQELLETAAIGGLSGAAFGGIGSIPGSVRSRGTTATQASTQESTAPLTGQDALLRGAGLRGEDTYKAQDTEIAHAANQEADGREAPQTRLEEEAESATPQTRGDVTQRLIDVIQEKRSSIAEGGILADLTGNEFSQGNKRLSDQVAEFFASLGNKVTRLGFGDVALTRRGAKDSIMHGVGRNKAIAFSAVPAVIEDGIVIDEQADWKGRGYDSVTFGGRIRINGIDYDMGVVVKKYDNENAKGRYYLHEVVLTNEEGETVPIKTGTLAGYPSDTISSSDTSLHPETDSVNKEENHVQPSDRLTGNPQDTVATPGSVNRIAQEDQSVNPGKLDSVGAARGGFDPYSQMLNQYGAIEPGENPARTIDVPQSTNGKDRVRKFARTYAESNGLTDEMIDQFEQDVLNGLYSYGKKSLASVSDYARKTIERKGFDGAMEQWEEVVQGYRRATDDDIGLAQVLLSSATAAGDVETASTLSAQIAAEGTYLGRAVNAFRLLKRTTPEGRLYYLNRCIDKINQDIYDNGKDYTVNLNGELAQALLGAETEADIDAALGPIYDDIARQIPPTIADRINAWRYLAMLGNPTTHIRNAIGNVIFGQTVKARDAVSALLQNAILRGDKADLRTRSLQTDKAARAFAKADFENVKGELGGNRYDSDMTEIQKRQNKLGPFQGLADFSSDMMTREDMWAKKHAYIRSLANYLTAKGIDTTKDIPPSILMDARAHAIEEAKYCTFQNFSELAQTIQNLEDRNAASKLLIGGIMPFKRTPINITKAAVDFSPVGLAVNIRSTVKAVQRGDVTAAEGIDKIASGLTGSAIAGIGALMAWFGLLRAGDDDDDNTGVLDDAEGSQEYSLVIPVGKSQFMRDTFGFQEGESISYSIDWAAPAVIPLVMGAEIVNALTKRDAETTFGEAVLESVMRMFDPVIEMTCMSGFSSAITGAMYNQDNPIYGALSSVAQNYIGQFVPTIVSKTAKTVDPVKRTTFYDANSKMPKFLQQVLQQNFNKIPGLSQNQPAALDVWGNESRRSDNVLLRVLQNFASPGELKKVSSSSVNDELRRLNSIGYEGMMPSKVSKSAKIDEERISAEQWSSWQTEKGQTAYNALRNFMGTSEYQALTDAQKAKFVDKVYEFASASGKVAAGGSDEDLARWITAANASESEAGMPREKFISLYAYKSALDDEMGEDEFSASIKQGVWEEYINGRSDLTDQQKEYVKDNIKFWTMKAANPSSYNKAKAAGYTDLKEIQALAEGKKEYDLDNSNSYSSAELYDYISSATDDNAEREKMWNALKDKGETKSWYEFAKEAAPKLAAQTTAKNALDNSVNSEKQDAFASALDEYGQDTQGAVARALMSIDATDSEREAYYNYIKAKRGWKKSWKYVKTYKIND